jgi:hypothetical protein
MTRILQQPEGLYFCVAQNITHEAVEEAVASDKTTDK